MTMTMNSITKVPLGGVCVEAVGETGMPRLRLDGVRQLWLQHAEQVARVRPVRCFPWSFPDGFISLRQDDGGEALFVEEMAELDPESANALSAALRGGEFVFEVLRVESIAEELETRVWHTLTSGGKRTFQTKVDEWPRESPSGGYLVRDLAGDSFLLPRLDAADKETRRWLWAYVG